MPAVRAQPVTVRLLGRQQPVACFLGYLEVHPVAQHLVGIHEELAGARRSLATVSDAHRAARVEKRAITGSTGQEVRPGVYLCAPRPIHLKARDQVQVLAHRVLNSNRKILRQGALGRPQVHHFRNVDVTDLELIKSGPGRGHKPGRLMCDSLVVAGLVGGTQKQNVELVRLHRLPQAQHPEPAIHGQPEPARCRVPRNRQLVPFFRLQVGHRDSQCAGNVRTLG